MKIKGNICETGGKKLPNGRFVNEDGLVSFTTKSGDKKYDFIILMDGATELGKDHQIIEGYTSAEWYVKFVMGILQRVLTQNPSYDLQAAVDFSISKAKAICTALAAAPFLILSATQYRSNPFLQDKSFLILPT